MACLDVLDPTRVGRRPNPVRSRVLSFETGLSRPANPARKPRYCGASSSVMLLVSMPSLPAIVSAITLNGIPRSPMPWKRGAGGRLLQRQAVEQADVVGVGGRPTVGAVADVSGGSVLSGEADQGGGEAVMVKVAVDHRRQPDDRGAHAPSAERERVVRRVDPRTTV